MIVTEKPQGTHPKGCKEQVILKLNMSNHTFKTQIQVVSDLIFQQGKNFLMLCNDRTKKSKTIMLLKNTEGYIRQLGGRKDREFPPQVITC